MKTKEPSYIGVKCRKLRAVGREPKPFKSGSKINTIKGLDLCPHTSQIGFTFEEDDSIVKRESIMLQSICLTCKTVSFVKYGEVLPWCEECKNKTFHNVIGVKHD